MHIPEKDSIHQVKFHFLYFHKEVTVIRSMVPINVIIYHPKTEASKLKLAKRIADAHASAVIHRLNSLNCPARQKLALLDAVIETVKERSKE